MSDTKNCVTAAKSAQAVIHNARVLVEKEAARKVRPDLWTCSDVGTWLQSIEGLGQYVDTFAKNEYNGRMLLEISLEELKNTLHVKRQNRDKILQLVPTLTEEYEAETANMLAIETETMIAKLMDPENSEGGVARSKNPLLRCVVCYYCAFLRLGLNVICSHTGNVAVAFFSRCFEVRIKVVVFSRSHAPCRLSLNV
jgi:hypothetical protein